MGTAEALAKRIEEAERKAREADQALKQLKAKKAAVEARQRAIEAKRRQAAEDRLRFEVGGLVKQAGLLELDRATLLGALLAEADRLRDPDYAARARAWGCAVSDRHKAISANSEGKVTPIGEHTP